MLRICQKAVTASYSPKYGTQNQKKQEQMRTRNCYDSCTVDKIVEVYTQETITIGKTQTFGCLKTEQTEGPKGLANFYVFHSYMSIFAIIL